MCWRDINRVEEKKIRSLFDAFNAFSADPWDGEKSLGEILVDWVLVKEKEWEDMIAEDEAVVRK